jgi:putative ABC transport system permease protein
MASSLPFIKGKGFSKKNSFQIVLGSGLAIKLNAKVKNNITVLVQTLEGVVNALDLETVGIFQTGIAEVDDNTFFVPLKTAQTLMDTKQVEQVVVLLHNTEDTDKVLDQINRKIDSNFKGKPWYLISKLYQQVELFNKVQNRMVEMILLALMLLAIMNTIAMSVFERTGEIGTIAALGEVRQAILFQFIFEGFLLGALGSIVGVVCGIILTHFINFLQIPIVMPGTSRSFIIEIHFYFSAFRDAAFLALIASTFAAIFPAVRASRLQVAEALRHNV